MNFNFLFQLVEASIAGRMTGVSNTAARKSRDALRLLKNYAWTCRYIDDLLTLGNPHLKKLLYDM